MQLVGFFGGKGTRARPMVAAPIQKHLITIGDRPLLYHVLNTALQAGATKLIASLNGQHPDQTIQTISSFNLPIPVCYTYSDPDPEQKGPLYDLVRLYDWLEPDKPFVVINGDTYFHRSNINFGDVSAPHLWTTPMPAGADPSHFGQVVTDGAEVTAFEEKPAIPVSSLISTGMALLPYTAMEIAERLCVDADPGKEMHIAYLVQALAQEGGLTHTTIPEGAFYDCGTPEAINAAHNRAWEARST